MQINNNRLMEMPFINRSYSKWKMPHKHLTTIQKAGDLVPVFDLEILPGDNIKVDFNAMLARMTTPIFPVMDDLYLDIYYFYVPNRIIYDKFPEFLGCKPDGYGIQETEYFIPSVHNIEYNKNDIGSYISNIQGKTINEPISLLYYRAYAMIYNEWFRDENLQSPYEVKKGYEDFDYNQNASSLSEVSRLQYGKGIAKACKLHDLFTSALPFTQRGPSVKFSFTDELPVLPTSNDDFINNTKSKILNILEDDKRDLGNQNIRSTFTRMDRAYYDFTNKKFNFNNQNRFVLSGNNFEENNNLMSRPGYLIDGDYYAGFGSGTNSVNPMYFTNLSVSPDISFSINDLRVAGAVQRYYEALSRSGNRFGEYIKGIFSVDIKDETIQRPIRLGSKRFNINMSQVIQTSSSNEVSPQGNVSGHSLTACDASHIFSYSFREPGVLLGLVTIRTNNTYPNALPRHLSHLRKFDFYIPQLQAIGEQAILNKEIYYSGDIDKDNKVFGYQEAWYEYRYKPSKVTGDFNDNDLLSAYAPWTYASYFTNTPVLNDEFIKETGENVNRTLAVQDGAQFLLDYRIVLDIARLMPLYSIPGYFDHF